MRAFGKLIWFKKRPVIVLILFSSIIGYHFVNREVQSFVLRREYNRDLNLREANSQSYILLSQHFAKARLWDELRDILESARQHRFFDFYLLQFKGEPVWWAAPEGVVNNFKLPLNQQEPWQLGDLMMRTVSFGDETTLTVGYYNTVDKYVENELAADLAFNIQETIIYSLIVLGAAIWSLRDFLAMAKSIRSGKFIEVANVATRSTEAGLLAKSFAGYSERIDVLKADHERLENQLLPSLRSELRSGQAPPYSFSCTLVRTDINGFSRIFATHNRERFMAEINQFFTEVSEIVARYGGFVHEFIGDEVIFYFKDRENPDGLHSHAIDPASESFVLALHAIEQIGLAARRLDQETQAKSGYPFTVKSSLAHGALRFGPLVHGFSLAGETLIETVRVLSHVNDRSENAVFFDDRHLRFISGRATTEVATTTTLKGLDGTRTLMRLQSLQGLGENQKLLLSEEPTETVRGLRGLDSFRSDADLIEIFRFLASHSSRKSTPSFAPVFTTMQSWYLRNVSEPVIAAYFSYLEKIVSEIQANGVDDRNENQQNELACAISLAPVIFARGKLPVNFTDLFLKTLAIDHGRINANAILALSLSGTLSEAELAKNLGTAESPRLQANLLTFAASRDLNKFVLKRLRQMLHSSDAARSASALYAIGSIAAALREKDLVYFKTRTDFFELLREVAGFVTHPARSVQDQAMLAVSRAGDTDILAVARAKIHRANDRVLTARAEKTFAEHARFAANDPYAKAG